MIYLYYYKKLTFANFLIGLFENHESFLLEQRQSFEYLQTLATTSWKKPMKKNSDIYKVIAEENLLIQYLKTTVMRETLVLAMWHCIFTKKRNSQMILKILDYNKQPITHW